MSRLQFRIPNNNNQHYQPTESMTPMKYSQQFKWKEKLFIDDNSVYERPHGSIVFDHQDYQEEEKESLAEGTFVSSIEDTLMLDHEEEFHLLQHFPEKKTIEQDIPLLEEENSHLHGLSHDPSNSLVEYQSQLAVRSNYFSTGSTRTKPLIKLHFKRKRKFQQKHQLQLRDSLHMMSLTTKQKILQEIRSKTAPLNSNPRQTQPKHMTQDI